MWMSDPDLIHYKRQEILWKIDLSSLFIDWINIKHEDKAIISWFRRERYHYVIIIYFTSQAPKTN